MKTRANQILLIVTTLVFFHALKGALAVETSTKRKENDKSSIMGLPVIYNIPFNPAMVSVNYRNKQIRLYHHLYCKRIYDSGDYWWDGQEVMTQKKMGLIKGIALGPLYAFKKIYKLNPRVIKKIGCLKNEELTKKIKEIVILANNKLGTAFCEEEFNILDSVETAKQGLEIVKYKEKHKYLCKGNAALDDCQLLDIKEGYHRHLHPLLFLSHRVDFNEAFLKKFEVLGNRYRENNQ